MKGKKITYFLLTVGIVLSLVSCGQNKKTEEKSTGKIEENNNENKPAETKADKLDSINIKGKDLDTGETVGKEMLKKDINIVVIWQESCPPCKEESQVLEALSKKRTDVDVIGLGVAESEEELKTAVESWGLTYKNYLVTQDFLEEYKGKIKTTPTVLYLDKEGNELKAMDVGYKQMGKPVDEVLKELEKSIDGLAKAK